MRALRTIIAAGLVTLALPGIASAETAQSSAITGDVGVELSITDPADINLSGITHAGPNAGSSSLVLTTTNPAGATVTATDASTLPSDGHLVIGANPLLNPLSFTLGTTTGSLAGDGVVHSVDAAGTSTVPIAVSQAVAPGDNIAVGDAWTNLVVNYAAANPVA
jgi:hypothetical protein